MTEPQKLTDLMPVEVLTAVHIAIAALEIQGPAITEALRQLDQATTMAWKAVSMLGVTDEEWELVKRRSRHRAWLGCGLPACLHIRPAEHAAARRRNA